MSDADEVLRTLLKVFYDARRSRLRVVGTPEEERMYMLSEAIAKGLPLVDAPSLKDGRIIVASEAIYMNATTREKLVEALLPDGNGAA